MMTKQSIDLMTMAEAAYDAYIDANLNYDLHPPLTQWHDLKDETINIWCGVAYGVMTFDSTRYDAIKKLKDLLNSTDNTNPLYSKLLEIIKILSV